MIHSENLVHEYSRRDEEGNVTGILRAVDGVSIDVKDGDFIAILGANGSGKSTLVDLLRSVKPQVWFFKILIIRLFRTL